jgi:octaprenyl-diphosphate synthase
MPFPLDSSLVSLVGAAEARGADARLQARLEHVQELLGQQLSWVERALGEAVEQGATPGTDAARHLIARGGKRVRPVVLLLSAACFGSIPPAACELAVVAELLHSATLLHDDVIDEGMERRGAATSRQIWGNGVSVLAGDLLLVNALERTLAHAPDALPALVATLRRLVDGEIVQLRGRTELDLRESTYELVLRGKTASLFAWAASAGAGVGGATLEDCRRLGAFGEELGMAFQLVDDVLDYSGENTGKTLLADLSEGKLTLPLVLAVERNPLLRPLVLRIHAGDHSAVAKVSRAVVESGACAEVRQRARERTERALHALAGLKPTAARDLLSGVAVELAARAG